MIKNMIFPIKKKFYAHRFVTKSRLLDGGRPEFPEEWPFWWVAKEVSEAGEPPTRRGI